MRTRLTPINVATALRLTTEAGVALPVEQSEAWERFDRAASGRVPWERLLLKVDGEPTAVIALTKYRGRGFDYLWAKHGPVWLQTEAPTPEQEALLRAALVRAVRKADPSIVFVRLHAWHQAADTHELLQTMPIDRTVVVPLADEDGAPLDDDALMASFKKRGRRDLRKGMRENPLQAEELTARGPVTQEQMTELYQVLVETAERDEFGVNDMDVYFTMLQALGPSVARVFVARDGSGSVIAWNIVTVYDRHGTAYYGASTREGRRYRSPEQLYWHILTTLRDEGVLDFDFFGVDSERAPRLKGVAEFKRKFSEEITEIAGAWDVPVHPRRYRLLVEALKAKRTGTVCVRQGLGKVRTLAQRLTGAGE